MTEAVLETFELSKRFHDGELDVDVLDNISFRVVRAESVAVLGASGSGKSTLLHLLGGLDTPTTGRVQICGRDLTELSEDERGTLRNQVLGFVYQFHHLLPEFSALENVAMPLLIGRFPVSQCRSRALACLGRVGLDHRVRHRPAELSGGERQRVAIARALVCEPKCVLADEPTGNLDRSSAEQALEAMIALRRGSETALVIVTHDERIAAQMDRVVVLDDGRIRSVA
ncbi:MAG: lipoprotein-releasing ABC transporter ATP-binding protein LolD [Gammaproteobacteria bacterium]|jgi:lipoprotein-releasing system ATP-binding protein|nr:lipoprotein-releasing ABC transporter ATP-binding protein LolD [Gammaproteobacteria bacterium]